MFCTRCFNFCPFLFLFISYRRLSRPPFHQDRPCGVTRDLHVVIPSGEFQGCVFYDLEAPFDPLTDNPSSLESFCAWLLGWHFLMVFLWLLAVHLNFPLLFPSPIQGSELDSFFILHLHSCLWDLSHSHGSEYDWYTETPKMSVCSGPLPWTPDLNTDLPTCLAISARSPDKPKLNPGLLSKPVCSYFFQFLRPKMFKSALTLLSQAYIKSY